MLGSRRERFGVRERLRSFPRHEVHVFGKELLELDSPGMIRGDHPQSRRERLRGDSGKRLEPGRQDEEIRRVVIAGKLAIVDEAEESHGLREAEIRNGALELASRVAFARDPRSVDV